MEWISVDERLPEDAVRGVHDSKPYLVALSDHSGFFSHSIGVWLNNRWWDREGISYPKGEVHISHWMPLPDPPEQEVNSG